MQKIFKNPAQLEKDVKQKYSIPDFLMMENAASGIADFILKKSGITENQSATGSQPEVLFICGKGNNGGDGYAVARKLCDKMNVKIFCTSIPTAKEALYQHDLCKQLKLTFISKDEYFTECRNLQPYDFIIDCLFGIGFHGTINADDKKILQAANDSRAVKIACDIPSALEFNADYTLTMGSNKLSLYSDKARNASGKIILINLGIPQKSFEQQTDIFLIQNEDMKLPFRKDRSVHKGAFGFASVFAGEKPGAGIIAATSALHFGAGYSCLIRMPESNLEQFQVPPELMIDSVIPPKTTCILTGSGLGTGTPAKNAASLLKKWIATEKKPCCVFDADIFYNEALPDLLEMLNKNPEAQTILTPHPKEFVSLMNLLSIPLRQDFLTTDSIDNTEAKMEAAKIFMQKFPNAVLIMKSSVTYIAAQGTFYICADGNQSLAKAGSGDVLAGLACSLLAQGYTAKDAAITAVQAHASASTVREYKDSYALTPQTLIENLAYIGTELK